MSRALFSFSGRLRRLPFLGYLFLALVLVLPFQLLGFLIRTHVPAATMVLGTAASVLGWWCLLAVTVKRLHDMNRSGVVLLCYFLALALGFGLGLVGAFGLNNNILFIGSALTVTVDNFAFNMWLLFAPGTPGRNRFDRPGLDLDAGFFAG